MIRTTYSGRLLTRLAHDNLLFGVLTTVFLYGCYMVYAQATRPLLKSEIVRRKEIDTQPSRATPALPDLPADIDPETTDTTFQIVYRNTLIFFHQRKLVDDNRTMKLVPFRMIMLPEDGAREKESVVLECDSATLRFRDEIELTEMDGNELLGGSLQGQTRVTGPRQTKLAGQHFEFFPNTHKIVSDHPLNFRFEKHTGSATGVEVRLKPPAAGEEMNFIGTSGDVQSVVLHKDVKMDIIAGRDDPTKKKEPDLLKINTQGRFEYDFETGIASFEDEMKPVPTVSRYRSGKLLEKLYCNTLRLQFADRSDESDDDSSNFEFERLTADGRQVLLNSLENDLTIQMQHLAWDNIKKRATLLATLGYVEIKQNNRALFGKRVEIQQAENGRIETVRCVGPGYLTDPGDNPAGGVDLTASWKKQFQYGVDPNTGLQLITLIGEAVVQRVSQQSELRGERLDVWTDRIESGSSKLPLNSGPSASASDKKSRPRIHQITATGDVFVDSPDMKGQSREKLTIQFLTREQLVSKRGKKPKDGNARVRSVSQLRNSDREKLDDPIRFSADSVNVSMAQPQSTDEDPEFVEAWLTGTVTVKQKRNLRDLSTMNGDKVHITNNGADDQVVEIHGAPAKISDEGRLIEGEKLTYERQADFARVSGAGHVRILVDQDMEGNPLSDPQPLDIHWTDRMTFDGRTAKFYGAVRGILNDQVNDQKLWCDRMHVTFSRRINYQSVSSEQRDANINAIEMFSEDRRPVRLLSTQQGPDGNTIAKRIAEFRTLQYRRDTGQLTGTGPGLVKSWRPGQRKTAALSPVAAARANQGAQPQTRELEFVWIDFLGDMIGKLHRRTTEFRQVKCVTYGFVNKMDEEVDPNQETVPEGSGLMRCARLQVEHFAETEEREAYVILVGTGNVQLEGHDYHAKADRISFDQSKDTFVLNTYGDTDVLLVRQTKVGGKVHPGRAQRIRFIPSRDFLEVIDASGVFGSSP